MTAEISDFKRTVKSTNKKVSGIKGEMPSYTSNQSGIGSETVYM